MIWFLTILILVNLLWPIALMIFLFVLCYRLVKFIAVLLWRRFSNRMMLEQELKEILGDTYQISYRSQRKIRLFKRNRSAKGTVS